jgi:hypothetical protein
LSQDVYYYCFTVAAALQESRGAPQDSGVVEFFPPELLVQSLSGPLALVAGAKSFSQDVQYERLINTFIP